MRIGVIGAGQLGRMLALAGYPLALQFRFLDATADSPGAQVAPIVLGSFDDPASLRTLAGDVDLVTYEFENVPVSALEKVSRTRPCLPPVEALRVSQDRLLEKELFRRPASDAAVPRRRPQDQARGRRLRPASAQDATPGYVGRGQFFAAAR
jgi:5-(carboxyamino)imidazole ribonucleotide synthase